MSNMIKMRNVGAQTQKKWRPGGPPPEGWGPEGWGLEEWGLAKWGPEGWGPAALELETCTFEGPGLQKHHQNSTRRASEREREKERKWGREGKKSAKFWLGFPAEGVRRRK